MKKLFLIMFCVVLLVGTVMANELLTVDNIKQYDKETQTVTIVNTFGIGRDIATIQLLTPLKNVVAAGYNKVAEFEIDSFDDTYTDAFEKMEFYDLNNDWNEINREFDYKYKTTELVDVNDYGEVCSLNKVNGTEECNNEIIGTHQEEKEVWLDFDTKTLIKGKVTIGIFTDVQVGDKVEWIPTLFGKKINEFAIWTAELNTGLVAYYTLNDTSGNIIDSLGNSDGIVTGNPIYAVTGKIGTAITGGRTDASGFFNLTLATTSEDTNTISVWFKGVNEGTGLCFAGNQDSGGSNAGMRLAYEGTNIVVQVSDSAYGPSASHAWTYDTDWHHLVGIWNNASGSAQLQLWFDNVNEVNGTWDGRNLKEAGNEFRLFSETPAICPWTGNVTMDEVGIWNRTLTGLEINSLYNSGNAITYTNLFGAEITLNSPVDNYNSTEQTINFNGSVVDNLGNNVVNVSLIIDDEYIETNSSGLNNTDYIFTKILSNGNYNWTYEACDDTNNCLNATSRSLTVSSFIEEKIFYNLSSHETQKEIFTINLTTNGTQSTSAEFFYNDISQGASTKTGTDTNSNFSNTIDVPLGAGEKEFYWKITLGLTEDDSTKTNQTVNETVWTDCNATYTVPFLNISFKDESDLSVINASIPTSNFVYYLGSGAVTKTFTYVNNTDNYYYQFCATPNVTMSVNPYVQYKQGSAYPQRVYDADTISFSNDTTSSTLYLLGTSEGIYVTFQVINTANLVLSGVDVTAVREISGSDVTVGQGITGDDGGVTLWLNPDFSHDFTFNKSGFPLYETSFPPTQASYTITLGGGTTIVNSYFKGITYSLIPMNLSLTNDTTYTFGFNLTSTFWDLTKYNFDLRLVNGTIITGGTSTVSGTPLTKSYNTNNQTKIYLDYYWLINGTYTNGTKLWLVYNTELTQWSIGTFFTDYNSYMDSGLFGIDNFGRYLIIFIVIFFTVGIMSYKFGFTSPMTLSVMTFLIVFFFDVVVKIIPPLTVFSGNEVNYLLTMLTGLIAVMAILREATRV